MAVAALLIATGIGIGALGSHALDNVLTPRQLTSLDTAVDYQLLNALGLLLVGLLMRGNPGAGSGAPLRMVAGALFLGILCFSGGIYLMLAGAPQSLGLITPLGGVMLIGAWLWLAMELWRLGR
jgi:uncharacterized membrane protein YgdD (TMEM256/DUF423 family)